MDRQSSGVVSDSDSDGEATSPAVVRCESVTREYRQRGPRRGWVFGRRETNTVRALEDVSLAITRGEFVAVTGPSGSGKTTLLHLLAGLDTPTSGTVWLADEDVGGLSERARARLRLATVGIVFQRFHLLPSLSARANVALPLVERGVPKPARRERAAALLDRVGLGDRLTHTPGELSGGEQQRVAIARALANDPALLIADEPTGELDRDTGATILELFDELAADHAVVVASHDDAVAATAGRVVRLVDGRLVGETATDTDTNTHPNPATNPGGETDG